MLPKKKEGICDVCDVKLQIREDDVDEKVVRARMK